ncbi:MAG TPA: PstS family phosphate ABC transporter substrate-binding protein [Patescibacteria group bacterium]|nr:PstS family phosphate ABC transporter substrate-binding protein [Patescibacteria group bacterium]
MRKIWLAGLLIVSMLTIAYGTGWSARQLETQSVHLRGSSNVGAIIQPVAELYMREHPGTIVTVTSIGTMRGIKSLIDATCNVAMASADSDDTLKKRAKDNNLTLTKHVIAYDALVPIVNNGNGINNLAMEDLRRLFSGEIVNWQQLGGADLPVIVASYNGSSGNYETWKERVMSERKVVTASANILSTNNMAKFVQQNPGAIGYVALPYLDGTVKPLTVNGISHEVGNITGRQYPIVRELALYTSEGSTQSVNQFVEYVLATDKGQQFVRQAGVIAVK